MFEKLSSVATMNPFKLVRDILIRLLSSWFLCSGRQLMIQVYRIRRNIGGALIWRIAEISRLADFNIGGRARGHVSNTLHEIISRI